MNGTELPVLGSIDDSGFWFILTTERLMWSIRDRRCELSIGDIRDAIVEFRKLQESKRALLTIKELQVMTFSGENYLLEMEAGKPLSGVWNVLKNIGTRNRHALERQT
jgi:hypothetical protein